MVIAGEHSLHNVRNYQFNVMLCVVMVVMGVEPTTVVHLPVQVLVKDPVQLIVTRSVVEIVFFIISLELYNANITGHTVNTYNTRMTILHTVGSSVLRGGRVNRKCRKPR